MGRWLLLRLVLASVVICGVFFGGLPRASSEPAPVFQVSHIPSHPLIFTRARNFCWQDTPSGPINCAAGMGSFNKPDFGTDVGATDMPTNPAALYILLTNGDVKKVFPLAIEAHRQLLGYANVVDVEGGAVIEPNVSLNGRSVIFTYVYAALPSNNAIHRSIRSDLFRVDLGPLIDNSSVDPASLTVTRLTAQPIGAELSATAVNPTLAAQAQSFLWDGVANSGGIEVPWREGLHTDPTYGTIKMVFVTNQARVRASNGGATTKNTNLYVADIGANGALVNSNRFQYYTTTAAMSPFPLRDGFGFSYIGNDKRETHWELQAIDSGGAWKPLAGFGSNASNSYHLASLCATQPNDTAGAQDILVSTSYYTRNNNGFGGFLRMPLISQGVNDNLSQERGGFFLPVQFGETLLSLGIAPIEDLPSAYDPIRQQFVGKVTSPYCALLNGTPNLYGSIAHSYANSNGNKPCVNANGGGEAACPRQFQNYDAKIFLRQNLTPFHPLNDGYTTVIDDVSVQVPGVSYYSLLYPRLMIGERERLGVTALPTPKVVPSSKLGLPIAKVGTSALYNTDVVPPECRFGGSFTPSESKNTERQNSVVNNIALLGYRREGSLDRNDPNGVCQKPVLPDMVGGVQVILTDNKTEPQNNGPINDRKEGHKLLGFYGTGIGNQTFNGQPDHSFQALIPANVPFSFQLIHKRYGLRMADVDSWHSLKARETRNDCGGCHGHAHTLTAVDIATTLAGQSNYVPADLVNTTPVLTYDATCMPTVEVKNTATEEIPVWGNTTPLFVGLVANCAGCHTAGTTTATNSFAVNPFDAEATYLSMKPYLSTFNDTDPASNSFHLGALGSSAFWAARGERTDGRPDCPSSNTNDQRYWCFRPEHHRNLTGGPLWCDGTRADAARWVHQFGMWLDNNAPREAVTSNSDRYHPSVTGALVDQAGCSLSQGFSAGFWDDTGRIASLKLQVGVATPVTVTVAPGGGPLLNGSYVFPANLLSGLSSDSSILKLTALDAAGNQQAYSWTRKQLLFECANGLGAFEIESGAGNGSNGGNELPTPTPTPAGGATPPGSGFAPPATPTPKAGASISCSLKTKKGGQLEVVAWDSATKRKLAKQAVIVESVVKNKFKKLTKGKTDAKGKAMLTVAKPLSIAKVAKKKLIVRARVAGCTTKLVQVK